MPPSRSSARAAARQAAIIAAAPVLRGRLARSDHSVRLEWARRLVPGPLLQVSDEIIAFAEFAAATQPVRIAEIGTFNGGTSLFLTGLSPTVRAFVGIDVRPHNDRLVTALAPRQARVTFLRGSSRELRVREQMTAAFAGVPIDILFIDGDHSYDGVRADLVEYRGLVRRGGLIAFHDIVPDDREADDTTHGGPWTGGVPVLWSQIRDLFESREFVRDWSQGGFGIGVIEHEPSVAI